MRILSFHERVPAARRCRGLTMMMLVITLLILAGTTTVILSQVFARQARRTRAVVDETQIRQLLLAAIPAAEAQLGVPPAAGSSADSPRKVPLPATLENANLALVIEPESPTLIHVKATATMNRAHGAETMTFNRQNERWVLTGVRMEGKETAQ